jgi:NitT/TauT family transport system permease protein/sulfonate transport system permease protein
MSSVDQGVKRATGTTRPPGAACVVLPTAAELDPVGYARRRRRVSAALGIAVPVVLIGLWQFCASRGLIDTRFFPAPSQILSTAERMIADGTLWGDVWTTLRALLIGFAGGVLVGVATGVLLAVSWIIRAGFEPLFTSLYTVPKLAILPLLLLIFGLGETPKMILVGIGAFFIMWISTLEAVTDIPEGYIEAAESFGVKGWAKFTNVILPAALPRIFTGLRLAIGNSVLIVVGIEFVNGDAGIGYRIWHSWSLFIADQMYVGIVAVALMGFVLALIIRIVARVVIPWSPSNKK